MRLLVIDARSACFALNFGGKIRFWGLGCRVIRVVEQLNWQLIVCAYKRQRAH
jgi:hypothetical protein